jgi:ankyrin repeat protein
LCIATWQRDAIKAKELLEQGADPNWPWLRPSATRDEGRPASPLWIAVANNQPELVKLLLDYGAIPNNARPYQHGGSSLIIEKRYYLKNIPQTILNYVLLPTYEKGITIFELANAVGNKEIIQLLNDYASGKKQPTRSFTTTQTSPLKPYQPSTSTGPQPTTGQPVQPQQPSGPQKTAYQKVMSYQYNSYGDAKFWLMAYTGDINELKTAIPLAQQKGLLNNLYEAGRGYGKMPAVSATIFRKDTDTSADQYLQIMKLLLQAGADPNVPSENNQPPLLIAIYTKAPIEYIETLLDAGANPDIMDEKGTTALVDLITDKNIKDLVQKNLAMRTQIQTDLTSLTKALNDLASTI